MWLGSARPAVRRTVKERGIKGYGFVQRIMLAAGGGTERGEQAVANAHLCIGVKRRRLVSVILPYRLNENRTCPPESTLPVAAGEEKRTRTRAHHSVIARDKKLFCFLPPAAAMAQCCSSVQAASSL